jgi:hypothetical protein
VSLRAFAIRLFSPLDHPQREKKSGRWQQGFRSVDADMKDRMSKEHRPCARAWTGAYKGFPG